MDGSACASPSAAAADVADTRGGEAPSESQGGTGSDKVRYQHGQPVYFPEELVDDWVSFSRRGLYYCYNISLKVCSNTTAAPSDIILAVKCDLGPEFIRTSFTSGGVEVTVEYLDARHLDQEQVFLARRFQITILSLLFGSDHSKVIGAIKHFHEQQGSVGVVYLLLPSVSGNIDWCSIKFTTSSEYDATDENMRHCHSCKDADLLQTMDGPCCRCMLRNSVVYAPGHRKFYNITGFHDLNTNGPLHLGERDVVSSKRFIKNRYGLDSTSESSSLLVAGGLCKVQNFLYKCYKKAKEPGSRNLPPELCRVVMAPVSTNTLCSFSFVPCIMYRIQCLLLSAKLKTQLGPRMQQFNITAMKILEALTTKECQEEFSQESLETLGDSFLKYISGQHLFSEYYKYQEDKLTSMREKLVSNTALCQLACKNKLVGYIRGETFNPREWIIPGLGYDRCDNINSFLLSTNSVYILKKISIKTLRIAATVEALVGAYLNTGGEQAAFHFIQSLGMDVELHSKMQEKRKITTKSDEFIDVKSLQEMLDYNFNDSSLLMQAMTHSSHSIASIAACNERLEFLGDAVLDHILTVYFFKQYYPNCTPALLTNLRKASANNCCYAHAAVKAGLHKHILHSLSTQMINDLENSGRSFSGPSHGWEPGIGLPEDLGDLIESLAGAIYLDSNHDKVVVWRAIRRLLEPLATDTSLEPDPVSELKELCERRKYPQPLYSPTRDNGAGVTRVVVQVTAAGTLHSKTGQGRNQDVAEFLAAKALLQELKAAAAVS